MSTPHVMTRDLRSEEQVTIEHPMPRSIDEAFVTRGVALALAYALDNPKVVFGEDFIGKARQTEASIAMFHFMPASLMPTETWARDAHRYTDRTRCTVCIRLLELAARASRIDPVAYLGRDTPAMSRDDSASDTSDSRSPETCDHSLTAFSALLHLDMIKGTLPELWALAKPAGTEVLP